MRLKKRPNDKPDTSRDTLNRGPAFRKMTKYVITKDSAIIRDLASKVVAEAHPGWMGGGYCVDLETWTIHYAEHNRAWDPWSDDAVVVGVDEIFDMKGVDASPRVEWKDDAGYLQSWGEIKAAYAEAEDGALEDDGNLADWVDFSEVISWACGRSEKWNQEIQDYEKDAFEAAVDLVESCVLEFVEIKE